MLEAANGGSILTVKIVSLGAGLSVIAVKDDLSGQVLFALLVPLAVVEYAICRARDAGDI
jgi:hypothetical protein